MAADPPADGYLFDLYRHYIGEPEDRTDVYIGFGLFLGGIGLAVVALALFLWSTTLELRSATYFAWVTPAYALVMVALPIAMLGIVVLLPSERRMLYTSIAGTTVTIGATLGFLLAYPEHWNFMGDTDYTVEVTATYAVGLAGLTAATGAALIAHYLDMAQQVRTIEAEESDDETETESYSDEEIQRDIDAAMEDVELSWGGVEETDHKRLQFSSDEFDDIDVDIEANTTRSTGVDDQVAGLKGLKGGDKSTTTSSSTVDDQTAKLKELREQQQAEEMATADSADGILSSIRERIRGLSGRK